MAQLLKMANDFGSYRFESDIFRLYDSKTKIEVTPKASIYDSAIKLDPQNSQFILFYQEGIQSYDFYHLADVSGKSLPSLKIIASNWIPLTRQKLIRK